VLVIGKKRHPFLLLAEIGRLLGQIPGHGCEAHAESELLKFRVDLSCTPAVLYREALDEILEILGCARTAW